MSTQELKSNSKASKINIIINHAKQTQRQRQPKSTILMFEIQEKGKKVP